MADKLQEVDFYLRLGFHDEARAELDEIAAEHPDHPELESRYRQLAEAGSQPAQRPQSPPADVSASARKPEPPASEPDLDSVVSRFVEQYFHPTPARGSESPAPSGSTPGSAVTAGATAQAAAE
ncbi:MAG: tetratricopeptide repeat protein [Acidobacteria bacterium]|nr:tetratricopeptide repeat protein [Acidobacteriota bacterium]